MIPEEYFGRSRVVVGPGLIPLGRGIKFIAVFALGPSSNGTADAAVTTTNTTLTDTRQSWTTNAFAGGWVTCNSKTMTVTSNTADTLTGTGGWSGGGNPGNGFAYSVVKDAISLPFANTQPDIGTLPNGYTVYVINLPATPYSLDIQKFSGATAYSNLKTGEAAICVLQSNGTDDGTWLVRKDAAATGVGSLIPATRETFDISIDADATDYNVRAAVDALGYTGANPAVVNVTIEPNVVILGSSTAAEAMATGRFPTFSVVNLTIHGAIIPRGGDGGLGGRYKAGTANAAVTTTDTTLTDTRLTLVTDFWAGTVVTCNGKTMTVTSNTSNTFTGASWSGGGNPGNGFAWTAEADATAGGDGGLGLRIDTYTQITIPSGNSFISGSGGGGGGGAQLTTGNVGSGGGGGGGLAAGLGGQGAQSGQNSIALNPIRSPYYISGLGGKAEVGSDAGNGGFGHTALFPAQSGEDSATDTGGAGGNPGDAIDSTVSYVLIGDAALRVYGAQEKKIGATATFGIAGTCTMQDAP